MKTRARLLVMLLALGLGTTAARGAEEFPSRPIYIVVPYPAGGTGDVSARIIGEGLTRKLGQPVVVESKPGGNSVIASNYVMHAPADGYTLIMQSTSLLLIPGLHPEAHIDINKDFVPVYHYMTFPNVLFASIKTPFNTVKEFLDYARKNPGKLNYGTGGTNSGPDLQLRLLQKMAGISMVNVPYKGGSDASNALLASEIDLVEAGPSPGMNYAQSGKLKALAVMGHRTDLLPGLPGIDEEVPGYSATVWNGLLAPAGTPSAVVAKLGQAISDIVEEPEVAKKFHDMGGDPVPHDTSAAFAQTIQSDSTKWLSVLQSTKAGN